MEVSEGTSLMGSIQDSRSEGRQLSRFAVSCMQLVLIALASTVAILIL